MYNAKKPSFITDLKNHYTDIDLFEFNDSIFPLDENWREIAISVSGGADSALLSYVICKHIIDRNLDIDVHVFSSVRMHETRPWQKYDSLRVFEYLKNNFPSITFQRHEHYIPPEIEAGVIGNIIPCRGQLKSGDQISVMSHAMYTCRTNSIDCWFAGKTQNPVLNFDGAPKDRDVEYNGDFYNILFKYKEVYICHPFFYRNKKWVMQQYKNLDIIDLLSITRSCEGDKNSAPEIFGQLDFETYVPYQPVPTCGKCFWCLERNWGLENII